MCVWCVCVCVLCACCVCTLCVVCVLCTPMCVVCMCCVRVERAHCVVCVLCMPMCVVCMLCVCIVCCVHVVHTHVCCVHVLCACCARPCVLCTPMCVVCVRDYPKCSQWIKALSQSITGNNTQVLYRSTVSSVTLADLICIYKFTTRHALCVLHLALP